MIDKDIVSGDVKRQLPNGWRLVQFSEICDFQGGTQPPKSTFSPKPQPGYVRLLQIQDFRTNDYAVYVPDDPRLSKCDETDVLIGRYGASVGRILRGKSGAHNVAIVRTIPNTDLITKDFLYYLLQGELFQSHIFNISSRAAQAGFNKGDFTELEIPLPPLDEQKRITAILNEQMKTIEKARKSAQEQLKIIEALPTSLLRQALNGDL